VPACRAPSARRSPFRPQEAVTPTRTDWSDNFNTPLDQTKWARYGWGGQAPGQGGIGVYQQSNAFTSGGRWETRAKFPVAKGIGYVFLLWPADGS